MKALNAPLEELLHFGLGDRLAKALHVSGVAGNDMAHELEVSRNTISNYLSGRSRPKNIYLKIWALKTGVPLEWLETGIFPEEPENKKAPTPKGESLMEPPAVIETATSSLQGNHLAEVLPFRRVA